MDQNSLFRRNHCLLGLLVLHIVWWFCEVSVFCLSGYLSGWLPTASSKIYILHLFLLFAVARNIWKSRPIPVEKGLKITTCWGFFEKFSHLSVLWMVLNESSCNFCFLIANPPHIYSEKFLILIYCPKMLSLNQNQLVLALTWRIRLKDSWNSSNSRKV